MTIAGKLHSNASSQPDTRVGRILKFPAKRKDINAVDTGACAGKALDAVMLAARTAWPKKTAAKIAAVAGVDIRRAERWLSRGANPSAGALAALLQCDHGAAFLRAIMSQAEETPAWWSRLSKQMEIAELEERLAKLKRGES